MIKITTKAYGQLEIDEKEIVAFKEGILGFPDFKKYILLEEEGNPFKWLQSIEEPGLAFVVVNPEYFKKQYLPDVNRDDLATIELDNMSSATILTIVVVPADPSKMTANLQGPVLINMKKMLGKQVISMNQGHKIKHYILDEMKSSYMESGN